MTPQFLPGIALPLKVFILGVPKCNSNPKVLIRHPTSGFAGAGLGGWRVVPENPSYIWLHWKQELEVVVWEEPHPSPLGRWPLGHPIKITTPWRFSPRSWLRIAGGCVLLVKCGLLMEVLHELMQFLVCEVTKLCLEVLQSAPTWVKVTSRWMRVTLPTEVEITV